MEYISSFTYCDSIQTEMTPQGAHQRIVNPLQLLAPVAIPGNYSFSVACNIAGFDATQENRVRIQFLSPSEEVLNDTGEISFQLPAEQVNENQPSVMQFNLVKLSKIASLKNGWNENGAKAFSEEFIKNVRCIVTALKIQPELFPTANSSIQIEYGNDKGAYLEIELNDSDKAEVFTVDEYGNESYSEVDANVEEINKVVNRFYG